MVFRVQRAAIGLAAVAALAATGLGLHVATARAHLPFARTQLALADGTRIGTVRFWDDHRHGATVVQVRLAVPPGAAAPSAFHGFHIHANDDPANGSGCIADPAQPSSTWFASVDGHLKHDAAETHARHAGDLPTIYLGADGRADVRFTVDRITPRELPGHAVILHAGADNFGNVPVGAAPDQYTANSPAATAKTTNTGNAGDRIACGVIR